MYMFWDRGMGTIINVSFPSCNLESIGFNGLNNIAQQYCNN